jgi:ABC-type branched-subunit amino acid transport system ATPase component
MADTSLLTAMSATSLGHAGAASADRPIIEIHDVDFSYGQLQVLFGLSLHVRVGEALALLGTNGAGKSTVLRVLCGLSRPSSGKIFFDGNDITGAPAERLTRSGLVLITGDRGIFPDMTVAENLEMKAFTVRRRRSWLRERTAYVLDVFPRLGERLRQPAGTMSGGEQQQLALAKALLLEPKVLCIDELSLGLAPVVVAELMHCVRAIHAEGIAVVLVEQSLNIAAEMCERAVFLEKGEVKFEGATRDLRDNNDIARAVFLGSA